MVDVKNLQSWNEVMFWAVTNEVHFGHTSQVMPAKPAQKLDAKIDEYEISFSDESEAFFTLFRLVE